MRKQLLFFIFGIFLLAGAEVIAQSQLVSYKTSSPYQLLGDKNPAFYGREMKKLQSNGKYCSALSNAIFLQQKGKKRHVKKANKFLQEHFNSNLKLVESKIQTLESGTQTFENETSAQNAHELLVCYTNMSTLKQVVDNAGGKYQVPDYSEAIKKASDRREDYFKKTAQQYFDEVKKDLPNTKERNQYRVLGRKLSRAQMYHPRPDIKELYNQIKPVATTKLGIGTVVNGGQVIGVSTGNLREVVHNEISSWLNSSKKNIKQTLPYFELVPNSSSMHSGTSDVLVEINVNSADIQTSRAEPSTEKLNKTQGEGSSKKTYSASYTTYSKTATVYIKGTYIIKDVKTGEIILNDSINGESTWTETWFKYSGNIEALSKSQKRSVQEGERQYPPRNELINEGIMSSSYSAFVPNLTTYIKRYANSVGK